MRKISTPYSLHASLHRRRNFPFTFFENSHHIMRAPARPTGTCRQKSNGNIKSHICIWSTRLVQSVGTVKAHSSTRKKNILFLSIAHSMRIRQHNTASVSDYWVCLCMYASMRELCVELRLEISLCSLHERRALARSIALHRRVRAKRIAKPHAPTLAALRTHTCEHKTWKNPLYNRMKWVSIAMRKTTTSHQHVTPNGSSFYVCCFFVVVV